MGQFWETDHSAGEQEHEQHPAELEAELADSKGDFAAMERTANSLSNDFTGAVERITELTATCDKQSKHISEQGKRIAELEEQYQEESRKNFDAMWERARAEAAEADLQVAESVRVKYQTDSAAYKAERDKLRDYAGHTPGCPGMDWQRHSERGCSCGWVQTEVALNKGGGG